MTNGTRRYAVVWREESGPVHTGRLELGSGYFRLDGTARDGCFELWQVPLAAVSAVRICRMSDERIDGLPSLIVERGRDEPLLLADATGGGAIHELADAFTLALPPARSA